MPDEATVESEVHTCVLRTLSATTASDLEADDGCLASPCVCELQRLNEELLAANRVAIDNLGRWVS